MSLQKSIEWNKHANPAEDELPHYLEFVSTYSTWIRQFPALSKEKIIISNNWNQLHLPQMTHESYVACVKLFINIMHNSRQATGWTAHLHVK